MNALKQLLQIVLDTCIYWFCFLFFWWCPDQPISSLGVFGEQQLPRCHLYTLAKTLHLWDQPHYRARSFAEDLRDNLRNVAVPGTGIPLSVFCHSKLSALLFILLVNPTISLVAAVHCSVSSWWKPQQPAGPQQIPADGASSQPPSIAAAYRQFLLYPTHWFAVWRHNCMLVGYHALVTGSSSYRMEAKGTFLLEGQRLGLPVSPFYSDGTVFVKHTSIEGGMGIHVFKNFAQGGEWVIQPALRNSKELSRMLPPGAPLSTLRVVTASSAWLAQQQPAPSTSTVNGTAAWVQQQQQQQGGSGRPSSEGQGPRKRAPSSSSGSHAAGRATPDLPLSAGVVQRDGVAADDKQQFDGRVQVVTAVWRAGLEGKDTDHSSICFPMDAQTGVLSAGVSANHWYKLGWRWLGRVDAATSGRSWVQHPDSKVTVAGASIPGVRQVMQSVMHAHLVAAPDVPLVGWDVALTPSGVFLLEMNLSCNLFNGSFDSRAFYQGMYETLAALDECRQHQTQLQQQQQQQQLS